MAAKLTIAEMRAGIERLQKRLEEVKQFDPQSVTEQYNIPQVQRLNAAVDDALVRTFGSDSLDYRRYRDAACIDNGPHNYAYRVPLSEVHKTMGRCRAHSIALLEQAIGSLGERIAESPEETASGNALAAAGELTLIADSRLAELRKLRSPQFDFMKLVRLCEETNTAYRERCYFATAMLVRGLLDHVPPLFGKNSFKEVANNYTGGGGKSFKDTMQHLENATRKVADAHLHMPIRQSETLPTAQQINCAQQLDVLLSEIIRILQ